MNRVKITIYKCPDHIAREVQVEYIKFEYDTGSLEMKKYHWDKLSRKKQDHLLKDIGVGVK